MDAPTSLVPNEGSPRATRRAFGRSRLDAAALGALAWATALAGCQPRDVPPSSYFDERISPILRESCVRQNTGCHLATDAGTAAGNIDLSSFDSLMRRSDAFETYGPYPIPLALLKPGDPVTVRVETFGTGAAGETLADRLVSIETNIIHAGGSTFDLGTEGYALVQEWIRNGHTRTGAPDRTLVESSGACRHGAGVAPGFDPAAAPGPGFTGFVNNVQPVLRESCAGSACHGNPVADLYLACGDDDAELRWNYWVSLQFVSESSSVSELLRRPLSTLVGGTYHEGGNVIGSTTDPRYAAIFGWIESLTDDELRPVVPAEFNDRAFRFFANRVQPTLVREGCFFLNCHGPAMFHDLRLRGGSGGHFGRLAIVRNYEMARLLLAMDASDPNESRIIAKNLYPGDLVDGGEGIAHRGGPLFEDFGATGGGDPIPADASLCDAFTDEELDSTGSLDAIPPYCILVRWHEIEREEELGPGAPPLAGLVWVNRPAGVGRVDDFDTYRGGATLRIADAALGAGDVLALSGERELSAGCGFPAGAADIRGPAVSWDGGTIAFSARTGAGPYRLYAVAPDGSGCAPIPGVAPATDVEAGITLHDFDPTFAPDGRLVFASSRGYLSPDPIGEVGPSRTPASLAPNANLFVRDADGTIRQLTFQLNQELGPELMTDGRLIMTAEKRELDFHMFAGRRLNLDGGDYHPLFAQRDSVGFHAATEFHEMLDRNLVFVASELDSADGAGTIVIVNRSIGPDQFDRPAGDRPYIGSMSFPVGRIDALTGAFRSPAPLPTGHLVVSCDRGATSLTAGGYAFRLCDLDPDSGAVVEIGGGAGANVEAAVVMPRAERHVFVSRNDEANGHTTIVPGANDAHILVTDGPMLATLLFANRRGARTIDYRGAGFAVYRAYAPPDSATALAGLAGVETDAFGPFFRGRELLGTVPFEADGSVHFRITGGMPIQLGLIDGAGAILTFGEGAPFAAGSEMVQREHMSFYPGERIRQSLPRVFFNALCGGCHGSISGRELDVAADPDIFTSASPRVLAIDDMPISL